MSVPDHSHQPAAPGGPVGSSVPFVPSLIDRPSGAPQPAGEEPTLRMLGGLDAASEAPTIRRPAISLADTQRGARASSPVPFDASRPFETQKRASISNGWTAAAAVALLVLGALWWATRHNPAPTLPTEAMAGGIKPGTQAAEATMTSSALASALASPSSPPLSSASASALPPAGTGTSPLGDSTPLAPAEASPVATLQATADATPVATPAPAAARIELVRDVERPLPAAMASALPRAIPSAASGPLTGATAGALSNAQPNAMPMSGTAYSADRAASPLAAAASSPAKSTMAMAAPSLNPAPPQPAQGTTVFPARAARDVSTANTAPVAKGSSLSAPTKTGAPKHVDPDVALVDALLASMANPSRAGSATAEAKVNDQLRQCDARAGKGTSEAAACKSHVCAQRTSKADACIGLVGLKPGHHKD